MVSHSSPTRTWDSVSTDAAFEWNEKATENVDRWGQQPVLALLLAKIEELGELAAVVDEHTTWADDNRSAYAAGVVEEMASLGTRTQSMLEDTTEFQDGTPIPPESRPDYGRVDGGVTEIWSELADDGALNFQLAWALADLDDGGDV